MVGILAVVAMISAVLVMIPIQQARAQDTDLDCFNKPTGGYICFLTKSI
jgi:biotin transporter BioY